MTSAKALVAAIWGAITGIVGSLTVVLVGNATLQSLTQGQWLAIIAAGLAGFGGGYGLTWATTNASARAIAAANQAESIAVQPVNPVTEVPPTPGV
jgi:hypothetical protein